MILKVIRLSALWKYSDTVRCICLLSFVLHHWQISILIKTGKCQFLYKGSHSWQIKMFSLCHQQIATLWLSIPLCTNYQVVHACFRAIAMKIDIVFICFFYWFEYTLEKASRKNFLPIGCKKHKKLCNWKLL